MIQNSTDAIEMIQNGLDRYAIMQNDSEWSRMVQNDIYMYQSVLFCIIPNLTEWFR